MTWLPRRLASERVPAGVSAVTIAAQPFDPCYPGKSVTVAGQAKVREIVALPGSLYLVIGPRLAPGCAQAGTPARAAACVRSPEPRMPAVIRSPVDAGTARRRPHGDLRHAGR